MLSLGSFLLPFMREAHQLFSCGEDLTDLDELCEASTPNHVSKRASSRQVNFRSPSTSGLSIQCFPLIIFKQCLLLKNN